ncbi:MAG: hypothetical protein EPO24_15795 [Bacteroidetes bacterium]|nr:MAG: hypothetical protein EPO24_15795 [Bacteroidota bacterium]
MKKYLSIISCCSIVILGCHNANPIDTGIPFEIILKDQDGNPVSSVTIEGGVDWDSYSVKTNNAGVAVLPGSARNKDAIAFKTNYIPSRFSALGPRTYQFNYSTKQLRNLGRVRGKAIIFNESEIVTLEADGNYHVYVYDGYSVTENFQTRLYDSANIVVRNIKLYGDTLWFTTHDSGIYVYSLHINTAPQFLFRIKASGYLGAFVVKDSIVILGSPYLPGPLRLLAYTPDGQFREKNNLPNYYVEQMQLFDNYLFLIGGHESLPTILNIRDEMHPITVYNGLEWNYNRAILYERQLILSPNSQQGNYKAMDFSNPTNPRLITAFNADAWLLGFSADTIAYGYNYIHSSTYTIHKGEYYSEYFQTVATVSEGTDNGIGGAFHPYYIIGDRLWKLVERLWE